MDIFILSTVKLILTKRFFFLDYSILGDGAYTFAHIHSTHIDHIRLRFGSGYEQPICCQVVGIE